LGRIKENPLNWGFFYFNFYFLLFVAILIRSKFFIYFIFYFSPNSIVSKGDYMTQPYYIDDRKRLTTPTKETIKREQEIRKMLADKFNNGFSILK
jgi:hypothetical protein